MNKEMNKVLVVEDNSDNLQLVTYALERAGYEVVGATTGEEAVLLVERVKPLFILMDIQLPGIDGIETTRQIRKSVAGRQVPIIAVTSYAMRGDQEKVLEAGCTAYFEKPIDPLTFVESVRKILAENR